jgi:hypothetical protein
MNLGAGDSVVELSEFGALPVFLNLGAGKDVTQLDSVATVDAGAGDDVIRAINAADDTISCGPGYDTVQAEPSDVLSGCERVLVSGAWTDIAWPVVGGIAWSEGRPPYFRDPPSTIETAFQQPFQTAQLLCWVDASGFAPCPVPFPIPAGIGEGRHVLVVAAQLTSGGVRTDTLAGVATMFVDRTPPPTPALSAPRGHVNTGSPSWSLADPGSLSRAMAWCRLDGRPVSCDSSRAGPIALSDGPHALTVGAIDLAGNESAPASYPFVVDTVAPAAPNVVSVTAEGLTVTAEVGVEAGSRLECQIAGGPVSACTSPVRYTASAPGDVSLAFRAIDLAGNASPATAVTGAAIGPTDPGLGAAPRARPSLTTSATLKVRGGKVRIPCRLSSGAARTCGATLKLGKRRLGSATRAATPVVVSLSQAARRLLATKPRLRAQLTLVATTADGQTLRLSRRVMLGR